MDEEWLTRQKTGWKRNAHQLENGLISLTPANSFFKKINPLISPLGARGPT